LLVAIGLDYAHVCRQAEVATAERDRSATAAPAVDGVIDLLAREAIPQAFAPVLHGVVDLLAREALPVRAPEDDGPASRPRGIRC
jgi:hypothetical protein